MPRKSVTSATVVPVATETEALQEADSDPLESQAIASVVDTDTMPPDSITSVAPCSSTSPPMSNRQRLQTADTQRGFNTKVAKNYRALAETFKQTQPFSRCPDGTYPAQTTCVMCSEAKPTCVFFPCQHMCVCNDCIATNDMSPDCSLLMDRCVCPICGLDIHIILPHTGTEETEYWNWILATKSYLPSQFKLDFKMAGKKLTEDSAAQRRNSSVEANVHDVTKNNVHDEQQISPKPVLLRRNTWSSAAKRANPYKVGEPNSPEACQIL